jgi:hypothetical protein
VFVNRHEQWPFVAIGSQVVTDEDEAVRSKHRPEPTVEPWCTADIAEFMERLQRDRHISECRDQVGPTGIAEVALDEGRPCRVLSETVPAQLVHLRGEVEQVVGSHGAVAKDLLGQESRSGTELKDDDLAPQRVNPGYQRVEEGGALRVLPNALLRPSPNVSRVKEVVIARNVSGLHNAITMSHGPEPPRLIPVSGCVSQLT